MASLENRIASAILKRIRGRRRESSAPEIDASDGAQHAAAPAKLRVAQFSDYAAVTELKRRWGLIPDSYENWEKLWRLNPALGQAQIERPIGWVLEAGSRVVG